MGEATALLGMVAHTQGRWSTLFRAELVEWVRTAQAFTSNIFDGHLCLAEFCLASPSGHDEMGTVARELLALAEGAASHAGRGLATQILGDLALSAGHLEEAERLLTAAEQHHAEAGAVAGRVLSLERLTQLALARGDGPSAGRFLARAGDIATTTWLAPHLQIRLSALAVQTAPTADAAAAAIVAGDRALAAGTTCQPCSMAFRTASAIALAAAGELEGVSRRLDEAERLAGMWNGGPWVAAIWEARGVLRRAQRNEARAVASFTEAADRYGELRRPLDQARCLARIAAAG